MDNTPKVPGPFSIIAKQLPKWWNDPGSEGLKGTVEAMVPQDAVDLGLMVAGGPGGKLARKAGVALMGAGASTDAQAGVYSALPSKLRAIVAELAAAAKAAHPQAAIEFANNGVDGKIVKGALESIAPSQLKFTDNGVALHTHPTNGPALPSLADFEEWRKHGPQQYLGVVRPQASGSESAVVIAPKRKPLPEDAELLKHQMQLFKANPEIVNALDTAGDSASMWKWLLDAGARDDIDLFLHNISKPPFRNASSRVPALQKNGPAMTQNLMKDIAKHVDYNGGVSPLLQAHLDAGPVLTKPKMVHRVIPTTDKEANLAVGDIYNFDSKNPSTSQSMRGITEGVLPGYSDFGFDLGDGASLFNLTLPSGEAYGQAIRSMNRNRVHDLQDEFLLRKSPPIRIESIHPDGTINGTVIPRDGEHFLAEGGSVNPMEHTRSSGQDTSTQPLTGSALKALVRGWIAGTAGLPGDVEGLARTLDKYTTLNPGIRQLKDTTPVLPTSDFYKEWLPGKQQGDDMLTEFGSAAGGIGVGSVAKGIAKAGKVAGLQGADLLRRGLEGSGPLSRVVAPAQPLNIIKGKGGNWLSGSVKDSLKGLRNPYVDKYSEAVQLYGPDKAGQYVANPGEASVALNNWIDKQLTRYIKNDMATEGDPIRALAERGVLHDNLDPFGPVAGETVSALRSEAGFPVSGSGKSDLAKTWENVSDAMLRQKPASYYQQGIGEVDNWLTKLSPETAIYQAKDNAFTSNLGFNHLMDELRNAVDVNSGLPPQLRLKPEDLAKVSVPQAVQRVAQINQWRADQKAAADLARANNAATVLHKEYPDKGFKWVELRAEKDTNPAYLGEGKYEDPKMQALKDALKYEGDTMGHCVGGYCEDVASGKSRIYSLRDAKGQPHVTIEAAVPTWESVDGRKLNRELKAWEADRQGHSTLKSYVMATNPEKYKQLVPDELKILQIKGKGNRAPNPEYLPFVQDFVKSGKWNDVGDLQNTGFRRATDAWNPNEEKMIRAAGIDFPTYATQQEIDTINQQVWPGLMGPAKPPGFAEGGSVSGKAPTWQDAYDEFQKAHQAQYGIGIDRPWSQDEDAARAKQQIDQKYIDALKAYDPTLAPDASVLGVNAQPNAYVPKPDEGGWLSKQLSNVGNIFRPAVQSVDDLYKDVGKATSGTINEASKLASESTGGIVSPDAAKVAAVIAYLVATGDAAGAAKASATELAPEALLSLGPTPEFAWSDAMVNPSMFSAPAISAGGATMSDAVMADLLGHGSQIGLNLANVESSANEILNAADLQKFLGGQTSGLVGNTAASVAGPFGPVINVGRSVFNGIPLADAAAKAVGSVALGKAIQGVAKETGLPTAVVGAGANYGVTGNAPQASDVAKTAISLYNSSNAKQRRKA